MFLCLRPETLGKANLKTLLWFICMLHCAIWTYNQISDNWDIDDYGHFLNLSTVSAGTIWRQNDSVPTLSTLIPPCSLETWVRQKHLLTPTLTFQVLCCKCRLCWFTAVSWYWTENTLHFIHRSFKSPIQTFEIQKYRNTKQHIINIWKHSAKTNYTLRSFLKWNIISRK